MPKTPQPRRRARRHDGWTPKRRKTFLETLGETANVRAAALKAGKSACGVYALRRRDAEFARAWDDALSGAMDELEAIALDRVRNGVEKTVVRGSGTKVTIREYSDRLLMFMLSRRRPEAYAAKARRAASRGRTRRASAWRLRGRNWRTAGRSKAER
ncbi:hypothetical protein [Sphingosinicella microcystinivorans]|uniref:hypothetical protein n=1 Tax=Sphingosinicella microcystinivorans TaxID=335406 RepID=UPI0022F3FB1B|nr:hypothetical protein [Sphingosinicella microcystinivorans]WBX85706.1 hypothetical protein PE061_07290 [Sphingosinicella microcystinivorans]